MKEYAGKRILMLLENCPYPQDVRVRHEATTLHRAGYEVSVIAQRSKRQPWRETVNGIHVYRYPKPPEGKGLLAYVLEYGYSLIATIVLTIRVWYDRGFDVIHAHNPPDLFVLVGAVYRSLGKRFIYDHHDLAPEMYLALNNNAGNPMVHRILLQFERMSCRLAHHVIATNESYKKLDIARSGIDEDRISIVRNGPDLARLPLTAPDPAIRQKAKHIVGYVGDMGYHDGVDYLLRASHHIVHRMGRSDILFVLIGKGDAWAELQQLAHELDLDSTVWFTGFVSEQELVRLLSSADVCVDPDPANPFTDRSTMIKMMEYMALAKPIVAFDLHEHRVTAQEAALYAKPNLVEDLACKIALLLDDPARREYMGKFGRQRIESELAWPHQEKCLLGAYASIGL